MSVSVAITDGTVAGPPDRGHRPRFSGRSLGRSILCLALLTLSGTAVAACGGSGSGGNAAAGHTQTGSWGGVINPGGKPVHGGTLTVDQYAAPIGVSSLHDLFSPDTPTLQVVAQIEDELVEFRPGQLDPSPGLAKSWTVSPDGLTYTFHLRQAKFSNGMSFTSTDVKYTLDLARSPKSFFHDSLYGVIKNVATPDPSTAVVTLSKPTPGFIYSLGNLAAGIVPSKLVKSEGINKYNNHPIGTGPFVLKRWVKNQEIDLVRNPLYWRSGLPYLNAVKLRVTPNDNTRVLDVQSGTVDVADVIPFSQVKTVNSGQAAKVLVAPGGDMYVIWITSTRKPLSELPVRQALNYATPVKSIANVVFGGVAPTMNTVYPKVKFWSSKSPAYTYDLAKAKSLLAKSSVPNGFSATIDVTSTDQASNQVAQIVQQAWAKIGVKLRIQRLDGGTLSTNWSKGDSELTLFTPGSFSTDVPVDDEFTTLLFNSPETNNLYTFLKDPAAAKLTAKATSELSTADRARDFAQLQAMTMQDPPVVPLVYTPNRAAVRNDVHNFNYILAGSYWWLDTVWKG
jgi:peptide/nickel transport system substrate-binding protein